MEDKLTFEAGMQELDRLARSLESGALTLEESFAAYERAGKLKAALDKLLDEGDRRIRVLTGAGERELNPEDLNENA